MKKQQKQRAARRPSKLDALATATAQQHAHLSTDDVTRRRIVLGCEINVVDKEILELAARLADARLRRAKMEAVLDGLNSVVGARG